MRPTHSTAGFSLIEVLIATGLLAGALVTMTQLIAIGVQANASARYSAAAGILASQKLEELSELSFDTLQALPSRGSDRIRSLYVRHWLIEPLPADPAGALVLEVLAAKVASGEGVAREEAIVGHGARLVAIKTRTMP